MLLEFSHTNREKWTPRRCWPYFFSFRCAIVRTILIFNGTISEIQRIPKLWLRNTLDYLEYNN